MLSKQILRRLKTIIRGLEGLSWVHQGNFCMFYFWVQPLHYLLHFLPMWHHFSKSRKYDLERSSSQVISHTRDLIDNISSRMKETATTIERVEGSMRKMQKHHMELKNEIADLRQLFITKHLHDTNHVPGFHDSLWWSMVTWMRYHRPSATPQAVWGALEALFLSCDSATRNSSESA